MAVLAEPDSRGVAGRAILDLSGHALRDHEFITQLREQLDPPNTTQGNQGRSVDDPRATHD